MVDGKQKRTVKERVQAFTGNQTALLVLVLVVLVAVFTPLSRGVFLSTSVGSTILTDWGAYILLAVAETLVVISGGIDLSVGATLSLATVTSGWVMVNGLQLTSKLTGPEAWPALCLAAVVAVATGLLVGAVNALLINVFKIVPFINEINTKFIFYPLFFLIKFGIPRL